LFDSDFFSPDDSEEELEGVGEGVGVGAKITVY